MTGGGARHSPRPRTSAPKLPALVIQRTMVPARIWLRPPAEVRNQKGCRNYRSTIYREAFGILTKAAQGRAVYPRDIDRTRRFPALKARRLSKVGGAQEEGGVEIGGKSWVRSAGGRRELWGGRYKVTFLDSQWFADSLCFCRFPQSPHRPDRYT